jgi:uncharacterized protein YbbK (DUF523 family)
LELALKQGIKTAVLRRRSPSCGCGSIYDGSFTSTLREGDGVTTALLKQHGISVISDDEFLQHGLSVIGSDELKAISLFSGDWILNWQSVL